MYLNLKAYFRLLFFPSQKERNIKNHKLLFWILRVTTVLMFSQLTTAVAAERLKQLKNFMYILLNIKYCGLLPVPDSKMDGKTRRGLGLTLVFATFLLSVV